MMISPFANVGSAVLLQGIGLQKNYTEVDEEVIDVIDYENPTCSECKCRAILNSFAPDTEAYIAASRSCENCQSRVYTKKTIAKKIYHNEKNRYGYRPYLKSNAIKLLITLHFLSPDRFGIVKNVNIDELAEELKCNVRTVNSNLETLARYNYISYSKLSAHIINVCLNDYDKYYLPANKGGRGFVVMSRELLSELINIDNLVSLRIHIREFIHLSELSAKSDFSAVNVKYSEMRLSLPSYCKPCAIKKAMGSDSGIFIISHNQESRSVRFEIREHFDCAKQKDACLGQYRNMFIRFMYDFNNIVPVMNTSNFNPGIYTEFFFESSLIKNAPAALHMAQDSLTSVRRMGDFKVIFFKEVELDDLASLALQYSYEYVLAAYAEVYKSYILRDVPIMNLGGLLRTIIVALQDHHISALSAA